MTFSINHLASCLRVILLSSLATLPSLVLAAETGLNTTTINIYRTSEFINRSLTPTVYIDGVKADVLENGNSLTITVQTGIHSIELKGEFPDWTKKYNKTLEVNAQRPAPLFIKLEPVYTGVVTPTQAETDFEFSAINNVVANSEQPDLKQNIVKQIFTGTSAEIAAVE